MSGARDGFDLENRLPERPAASPEDEGIVVVRKSKQNRNLIIVVFVVTALLLAAIVSAVEISNRNAPDPPAAPTGGGSSIQGYSPTKIKNVIMMVSDGMSPSTVTMIRQFKGYLQSGKIDSDAELAMDQYRVGSSRTYSSDTLVTDSAAGATCFSCKLKTYNGAIGVNSTKHWCPTVLEAAKLANFKTGLVVTSRITHATPASFAAHVPNRNQEQEIATQLYENEVDVMFGGGRDMFNKRTIDSRNLVTELQDKGYKYLATKDELNAIGAEDSGRYIGLFATQHMYFKVDRDNGADDTQPGLLDMTKKGIDLLLNNVKKDDANGFFLMIEGSRIDQGEHDNDPVAAVLDGVEYDDVMEYVMNFAKGRTDTLVISTSDHATGGLSLHQGNSDYYQWYPNILTKATASAEHIQRLAVAAKVNASDLIDQYTDFDDTISSDEISFIKKQSLAYPNSQYERMAIAGPVSKRANLGWTTKGHTGEDVHIFCHGPPDLGICKKLNGVVQNTFIGEVLAESAGFTQQLFDRVVTETHPKLSKYDGSGLPFFHHAGSDYRLSESSTSSSSPVEYA